MEGSLKPTLAALFTLQNWALTWALTSRPTLGEIPAEAGRQDLRRSGRAAQIEVHFVYRQS